MLSTGAVSLSIVDSEVLSDSVCAGLLIARGVAAVLSSLNESVLSLTIELDMAGVATDDSILSADCFKVAAATASFTRLGSLRAVFMKCSSTFPRSCSSLEWLPMLDDEVEGVILPGVEAVLDILKFEGCTFLCWF